MADPMDRNGDDDAVPPADDNADGFVSPEEAAQLQLVDDDAPLPWLEGDEDEDEYTGYDTGRLIGFALLGLLALVLVIGGIWWATRGDSGEQLVADGGVIEAPEKPYKEKPEDPGGKTFEGTGDSSFAVSEGQSRPAQLGETKPAAKPGFETVGKDAKPKAEGDSESAAPGTAVQVAAYSNRADAQAGWNALSSQYSALTGVKYRIVEGQADIGTVYRLQALPGSAAAAKSLCRDLQAAGLNCHIK